MMQIVSTDTTMEIWLTQGEKQKESVQEKLKTLYAECQARKVMPVVFCSGNRNLTQSTSDLLCYNRKSMAER